MHRVSECHRHLRACVRALRRAGTSSLTHRAAVQHRAAICAASVCEESDMRVCATALKRAESEPPLLYFPAVLRTRPPTAATMFVSLSHIVLASRLTSWARVLTIERLSNVVEVSGRTVLPNTLQLDLAPATSLGAHEFNDPIVLTPSVSRVPLKQLLELLQEMRREPEGGAALVDENAVQNLFFQPPPSSPAGSAGDEAAPPAAAHPPA